MNEPTLALYGYNSKSALIAKNIELLSSLEHGYDHNAVKDKIEKVMREGLTRFDWLAKKKGGAVFWTEVSLKAAVINKKQRILAVVRDISDRKKAEEQLTKMNRELLAIFKTSLSLQNLKAPQSLANELIDVLEVTLHYENLAVLLLEEDGEGLYPFALSRQGKDKDFIEKDKKYLIDKGLKAGFGITGIVAKMGKSIRTGNAKLHPDFIDLRSDINSELCVPIIVENKVIGVLNSESKTMHAYDETDERIMEIMASQIGIALHNANLYEKLQIELKNRIQTENELKMLNLKQEQLIAERTKELQNKVEKLDKSQKAMLYMVEDLNDMTEELKSERIRLTEINKELESFSYSVSHDLRAPLRAIDGFSRILVEDYTEILDKEGIRLLGVIRNNTAKMDRLITDLLQLSRVSRSELQFVQIDMNVLIEGVFMDQIDHYKERKVNFSMEKLPDANADPVLMRHVWQNLISNALKYSKPEGDVNIEISFYTENKTNVFLIKDNGVGFNQEYAERVFETFQRLHREDEFEGTGIGLSIVKRIIQRHGGHAWAKGEVDNGACFYISLPQVNDQKQLVLS